MAAPVRRIRLDERLVRDGLVESRAMAQRLVMAGSVLVDGLVCDKSSAQVANAARVELRQRARFVSRGGDKLDNAISDLGPQLEQLGLRVEEAHAIDVGCSHGGFSDCLLQRGAATVIAVDVGYGQLHPKLRGDQRVTVMERTNARYLTPDELPRAPDLIVCDTSFISLTTVLPAPLACMQPGFWGLLLCKPQFEAGPARLRAGGKGGVIRDAAIRDEVLAETVAGVRALGVSVDAVVEARPPGPKGNIEYVLLIRDSRNILPS